MSIESVCESKGSGVLRRVGCIYWMLFSSLHARFRRGHLKMCLPCPALLCCFFFKHVSDLHLFRLYKPCFVGIHPPSFYMFAIPFSTVQYIWQNPRFVSPCSSLLIICGYLSCLSTKTHTRNASRCCCLRTGTPFQPYLMQTRPRYPGRSHRFQP